GSGRRLGATRPGDRRPGDRPGAGDRAARASARGPGADRSLRSCWLDLDARARAALEGLWSGGARAPGPLYDARRAADRPSARAGCSRGGGMSEPRPTEALDPAAAESLGREMAGAGADAAAVVRAVSASHGLADNDAARVIERAIAAWETARASR